MKESLIAALWSVFIFPGGGHFYLKKWLVGSIMSAVAVGALAVILTKIIERANQIADQIILGEIPFDLTVIVEMVTQQTKANGSPLMANAWYVLITVWLVAAIDAYRLGHQLDRKSHDSE